jgi:hypothetical protein
MDTVPRRSVPLHDGHHRGHRLAIAMWNFSWLERRWPGAGYEDWDRALDGSDPAAPGGIHCGMWDDVSWHQDCAGRIDQATFPACEDVGLPSGSSD